MTLMEENTIQIRFEAGITEVIINRPQSLNALNADVLQGLILTFDKINKEDHTKVVIISGAGEKAFVAGADIATMSQLGPRAIADYVELGQRAMRTVECAPMPVIAAVNGYALGGGLELALACDLIVAAQTAKVGQPEVNLGIIPGFGGTQRLLQRCSIGLARRLVYTGDMISAEEAYQGGLVDKVVEVGASASEAVLSAARAMAGSILKRGPLAVSEAKRVMREAQEQTLISGLRREVDSFLKLFQSVDREEGMEAFLKKREPTFRGK